ncbi:MAG: hypothetical protein ACPIOQ_08245 [Promethearchaeia archaeon]
MCAASLRVKAASVRECSLGMHFFLHYYRVPWYKIFICTTHFTLFSRSAAGQTASRGPELVCMERIETSAGVASLAAARSAEWEWAQRWRDSGHRVLRS